MPKIEFFDNLPRYIADGLITARPHPQGGLTIYNYTPKVQYDRLWDNVTRACRGLILDDQGNVVARPFQKFFNLDELDASEIPNEPFDVYEKIDGSLGIVYWKDRRPAIATRGSFESEQALHATALLRYRYTDSIKYLNPEITYLFEIVYPENRIVVDYGNMDDIFLLAAIETATGVEVENPKLPGIPYVKRYDGIKDLASIREIQQDNAEGFVIRFKSGLRVKLKFADYVRLHRLMTHVSPKSIWEYLASGQSFDHLLEQVPDEFYKRVKSQQEQFQKSYAEIKSICKEQFIDLGDRRLTAEHYNKNCKYPSILFKMLDRRDYSQIIWKLIKPSAEKSFKGEFDE